MTMIVWFATCDASVCVPIAHGSGGLCVWMMGVDGVMHTLYVVMMLYTW